MLVTHSHESCTGNIHSKRGNRKMRANHVKVCHS